MFLKNSKKRKLDKFLQRFEFIISSQFSILSTNHVVVKEELQRAVDAVEATLEAEEGKGMRTQIEVAQIRVEIENTRRMHQRTM